jgi:hypothetical protein
MDKASRRPSGGVTREEFDALRKRVDDCCTNLEVQFKRIAQIQAEIDQVGVARTTRKNRNPAK